MSVKLINFFPNYVCGNIMSINDLSLELSKYIDSSLHCQIDGRALHDKLGNKLKPFIIFNKICKCMYTKRFNLLNFESITDNDIIISTMWHVTQAAEYFNFYNIRAKSLILLDSLDVYTSYLNDTLKDILHKLSYRYKEIFLLANPFNVEIYKKIKDIPRNIIIDEYYTKLSKDRILTLGKSINNDSILLKSNILSDKYENHYIYDNHMKFINTLEYNGFGYCRHYMLNNGIYIENIGKILLEYIYLGRKTDYYAYNKSLDDGLHYYLKLLDIDDNVDNLDIKVVNSMFEDKLMFNKNDLILKIINTLS